jgi:hypothetical protein
MLTTFVFLGLITSIKPYCTVGLSSLQICSLVAEFITLFSGILLVINEYIGADKRRTGQSNSDMDYQTQIVAFMIFVSNFLVMVWPFVQIIGFMDMRNNCSDIRMHICGLEQTSEKKPSGKGFSFSSIVFFSKPQSAGIISRPDQVTSLHEIDSIQDRCANNDRCASQAVFVTAGNEQLAQTETKLGSARGESPERIEPLNSIVQPVPPILTYELYPGVVLDDTNQEVAALFSSFGEFCDLLEHHNLLFDVFMSDARYLMAYSDNGSLVSGVQLFVCSVSSSSWFALSFSSDNCSKLIKCFRDGSLIFLLC